jgi:hypothetical protein
LGVFREPLKPDFLSPAKRFDALRRRHRRTAARLAWISHSSMQP